MADKPYISVLVPVLNEEESLPELHPRLQESLAGINKPYEIIYINDGSTDRTEQLLEAFHREDDRVKVIEFNRNYGQHNALFAGFDYAAGEIVVKIDADLQNPPEEIPSLIAKAEEINPNASLITGVICGYRVENIEDPLMQKIRYMDKLVDELARGKKMTSILRGSPA